MPVTTEQQLKEWEAVAEDSRSRRSFIGSNEEEMADAIPALIAYLREARETISKLTTQVEAQVLLEAIQGSREKRNEKINELAFKTYAERSGLADNFGAPYDPKSYHTAMYAWNAAIAAQENQK